MPQFSSSVILTKHSSYFILARKKYSFSSVKNKYFIAPLSLSLSLCLSVCLSLSLSLSLCLFAYDTLCGCAICVSICVKLEFSV